MIAYLECRSPAKRRLGGDGLWRVVGMLGLGLTQTEAGWKAGTGRVAITPKEPMWMAGYAARTKPSEGAVHDLWAKALARGRSDRAASDSDHARRLRDRP